LRALLGRLAWQCKELGIHRSASCRSYPRADKVEQLFYGALYKDAWVSPAESSGITQLTICPQVVRNALSGTTFLQAWRI
jgi:hypothetical protein